MELFGPTATLDRTLRTRWQRATERYMEEFYNDGEGTGGLLDRIRDNVSDVQARVRIEDQELESSVRAWEGIKSIEFGEDDESYLPEFAIPDAFNRRERRLQTQVTEPCRGSSPLVLTFSLELSYRAKDESLRESNAVISFPFTTVDFRETYIDDYLKIGDGDDNDEGGLGLDEEVGFGGLYCTSRILFDTEDAPTSSPTEEETEPTSSPTEDGTKVPTLSPVDVDVVPSAAPSLEASEEPEPTVSPSAAPTVSAAPTMAGTYSPTKSLIPSNQPSGGLTSSQPSAQPSLAGSEANATTSVPSASPSPTVGSSSNATTVFPSMSPSPSASGSNATNGTAVPTSSLAPSASSPSPTGNATNFTASPSPSLAPSVSSAPSLAGNATNTSSPSPTSNSGTVPTYAPSTSPRPTTAIITPSPALGLRMDLFGLQTELDTAGQESYEARTAAYIEWFYNEYDAPNDGGARGDVLDVVAEVAFANQGVSAGDGAESPTPSPTNATESPTVDLDLGRSSPTAGFGYLVKNEGGWRHWSGESGDGNDSDGDGSIDEAESSLSRFGPDDENDLPEGAIDDPLWPTDRFGGLPAGEELTRFDANTEEDDLPEVAVGNRGPSHRFGDNTKAKHGKTYRASWTLPIPSNNDRQLQSNGTIPGDCTGPALALILDVTLEYRLRGPTEWTLDEIVNEPFSTAEYRDVYLNDFLKQDGDTFDDVTCTSEVEFPSEDTEAPTLSPAPSAAVAGTADPTLSPAPSAAVAGTADPTLSQEPTTLGNTAAPTPSLANGTASPSLQDVNNTSPTLIPTSSNETSDGSTSGEISGLEMDLIGLLSLTSADQIRYAQETASYIEDFYNGNFASQATLVSNVSATVEVEDQLLPMGPTTGTDCDSIDPLTLTFSLQMSYVSSAPNLDFDNVVTYPFSTEQFQQQYIDEYLKENDASGGFQDLQCVSEVRLPGGNGDLPSSPPTVASNSTSAPTSSLVPSASPTAFVDDIFEVRSVDPSTYERKCSDQFRRVNQDQVEEFELAFIYAVESTTSDIEYLVEDMESMILDFVAASALKCSGDSDAQLVKLRRREGGDTAVAGAVRVRYPEFGEVTSVSTSCEPVSREAEGCAVLSSKLLVTVIGAPTVNVHRDLLLMLASAFEENVFAEFIPDLLTSDYLGPSPDALTLSSASEVEGSGDSSSKTAAILFSVGCIVLVLKAVACFAFPTRKVAFDKVASYYRSRRHKLLPTCRGPSEKELAGGVALYNGPTEEELLHARDSQLLH